MGGETLEAPEPYLGDDAPDPISTVAELLEFLEDNSIDPTELRRAKNDFSDLQMRTGQSFREFNTCFIQNVSKAKVPKSE
jgi:hypothetical protein